jgi:flagellar basal body-associated protein FliL
MRKIETREEIKKRKDKNKIIISIVFAAILTLSTAGYAFFGFGNNSNGQTNSVNYNGLVFNRQGDLWQVKISGYDFYFHYLPNETRKITITKTLKDYANKPLYFNGESVAEEEIAANLVGNKFAERRIFACLQDTNCTENWPEKNCSSNIIIIQEKDFSNIAEEENCVFIFSNDTLRDSDSFLYRILGIN